MIELVIPGEPVGKQRAKVFPVRTRTGLIIRRGVTPEKTVSYETLIRELFAVRYPGFEPLEGPLVLTVEAFLGIPKSASKKKRAAMEEGEIIPEKRPDFDNLAKTAADALQGVAFRNDSQIAEAVIRKRWSISPRMRIAIGPMGRTPEAGEAAEVEAGGRLTEADIVRSQSSYLRRAAESLRKGEQA